MKYENADPKFILKSAEEKAQIFLPYVETRLTTNEAVSLEVKVTETGVKVQEAKRTDTKDRYMTLMMANLFGDKIINKYLVTDDEDEDIDWDEISLVV